MKDGQLTLDDLTALPHAARSYGTTHVTPADRVMDELSVRRRVQVTTGGFLPLPFLVSGTDLVTIIPERLAQRVAAPLGLAVAEPPFGRVELIENLWWHPDKATTPEHAWLRRTLADAAALLPPVASEAAAVRPVLALSLRGLA